MYKIGVGDLVAYNPFVQLYRDEQDRIFFENKTFSDQNYKVFCGRVSNITNLLGGNPNYTVDWSLVRDNSKYSGSKVVPRPHATRDHGIDSLIFLLTKEEADKLDD